MVNLNRNSFISYQRENKIVCFNDRIVKASELTYQEAYKKRKDIVFICDIQFLQKIARNTLEEAIYHSTTFLLDKNPALKVEIFNLLKNKKELNLLA